MTKKIISWLACMAVFASALQSCMNEDLYSSAEKQKQQIVSRSLWKEDTVFIRRIYDHFEKSFMSSVEEGNRFTLQYGTPSWEYSMTMGFGKSQLYVPLITGGRVTGMMQVLRQDKKAVYAFTQDPEALYFFETVIYNPRHAKLEPGRDQKTGAQHTAKGSYTWTCSKRIVITGWHMEGDTMVMQSSLVEVCKYTYTGMNPAVDHLEVDTDGMESGGGDDEGEEYEGSPCEKIKTRFADNRFKSQFNALNTQANFDKDHEEAFYEKATAVNGAQVQTFIPVSGPQCSDYIDLPTVKTGITGFGHTHNNYGCNGRENILIPSPNDIMLFLFTMVKQSGNVYNDYSQAYYLTVTSGGSYMFQYTGTTAPQNLTFDIVSLNTKYKKAFDDLYSRDASMSQNAVEEVFAKFLKEKVNIEGLEVYKITSSSSEKIEYNSNTDTVVKTPCPTS